MFRSPLISKWDCVVFSLATFAVTTGCAGEVNQSSNSVTAAGKQSTGEVLQALRPFLELTDNRIFSAQPVPVNVHSTQVRDLEPTQWLLKLKIFDFEGRDTYDRSFADSHFNIGKDIPIESMGLNTKHESELIVDNSRQDGFRDQCRITANLRYLSPTGQENGDPRSLTRPTGDAAALRSIVAGSYQLNYVEYEIDTTQKHKLALSHIDEPADLANRDQPLYRFVMGSSAFNTFSVVEQLAKAFKTHTDSAKYMKRVRFEFGNNPFFVVSCYRTKMLSTFAPIRVNEAIEMLATAQISVSRELHTNGLNPAPDATTCEERLAELDPTLKSTYEQCLAKVAEGADGYTKAYCNTLWHPEERLKKACANRAQSSL